MFNMAFVKTSIDCHTVNLLSVKLYTSSIKLTEFYHEFMLKVLYFVNLCHDINYIS